MKRLLVDSLLAPVKRRGGIILCFHQIAPDKFVSWTRSLLRHFRLVSLDEFVQRRSQGKPLASLAAITFDDGWADTCLPVARICEDEQWPITIYVMSSLFLGTRTFWFSKFPELVRKATGTRLEIDGHVLDLTSRRMAQTSTSRLRARLTTMPNDQAMEVISGLATVGGVGLTDTVSPFVDRRFLQRYARSEWVSFGSHSVDHQCAAAQNENMLDWQMAESKNTLEKILNRPIRHFCYPYGDRKAIGELGPVIVRKHYDSATTMIRGVCTEHSDPWYLPRISLYENDSYSRFVTKIGLASLV